MKQVAPRVGRSLDSAGAATESNIVGVKRIGTVMEVDADGLHACPVKAGCICDGNSNLSPTYDWGFADTVMCICLRDRNDRMEMAAEQFHRVGLCTRAVFYRPDRPSKALLEANNIACGGIYGCWESHRAVAILARDRFSSKANLVFEDDVLFTGKLTPEFLRTISIHLRQEIPGDWEMYMLGHIVQPMAKTKRVTKHLYRTKSSLTHAYIQSAILMERMRKTPYLEFGIDKQTGRQTDIDWWFGRNTKQYACRPMIAVQQDLTSDIRPGCVAILNKKTVNIIEPVMMNQRNTIMVAALLITIIVLSTVAIIYFVRLRAMPTASLVSQHPSRVATT